MQPQNLRFGGGVSATVLNPAVAVILVLAGILICFLPRKKAVIPFLLAIFLIPSDQILVVAGLHFQVLRILVSFGIVRLFVAKLYSREGLFSGGLNKIDKALVLLSVTTAVAGTLLFWQQQALIFQLGDLYTTFGAYFLLRYLIREYEDVVRVMRVLAVVVVVLSGVMLFEQIARWSPYTLLGGARAQYFSSDLARDGSIRATASFGTPILAGTFGAVLLPVFVGLWFCDRKQRGTAIVGMIGATVMTLASHSSTPAMGYVAGLIALCLWPVRSLTRLIRWGIVTALVSLQMFMKAPVYGLITRLSFSGDSYHRYALIDQTVRHFGQWWLLGTNVNGSWGWDMWDTANQYVQSAISGGLLGFILFVAIIVFGFKYVGQARIASTNKQHSMFFWALGSALFAYTVSFLGISLFDQSVAEWYTLLAFIGAMAVPQAQAAEALVGTVQDQEMSAEVRTVYADLSGHRFFDGAPTRHDLEMPASSCAISAGMSPASPARAVWQSRFASRHS